MKEIKICSAIHNNCIWRWWCVTDKHCACETSLILSLMMQCWTRMNRTTSYQQYSAISFFALGSSFALSYSLYHCIYCFFSVFVQVEIIITIIKLCLSDPARARGRLHQLLTRSWWLKEVRVADVVAQSASGVCQCTAVVASSLCTHRHRQLLNTRNQHVSSVNLSQNYYYYYCYNYY